MTNKSIIYFCHCDCKNAGDGLGSPKLYYDFNNDYEFRTISPIAEASKIRKSSIIIFGGGGIIDTNSERNKLYKNLDPTNILIHWGSGSNKLNLKKINWAIAKNEKEFDNDLLENFEIVGRRDYLDSYLPNHEYVPCVTCKLKYLKYEYEIKRRIGIVQHMWLKQISNMDYPTISMNLGKYNIEQIIKFIGESEVIITGSYHAAYWGLLLRKKVIINGNWSSKFDTLKYKVQELTDNIEEDIDKCKIPPETYLDECIEINDNFYKKVLNIITKCNH